MPKRFIETSNDSAKYDQLLEEIPDFELGFCPVMSKMELIVVQGAPVEGVVNLNNKPIASLLPNVVPCNKKCQWFDGDLQRCGRISNPINRVFLRELLEDLIPQFMSRPDLPRVGDRGKAQSKSNLEKKGLFEIETIYKQTLYILGFGMTGKKDCINKHLVQTIDDEFFGSKFYDLSVLTDTILKWEKQNPTKHSYVGIVEVKPKP